MKSFLWAIALLILAGVPYSYAQSTPTIVVQESTEISGAGGLFFDEGFLTVAHFIGPGVNLYASQTNVECTGCGRVVSIGPGTSGIWSAVWPAAALFAPPTIIGSLTLGGQTINCQGPTCPISLSDEPGITSLKEITFPTDVQDFGVTVPAVDGPLAGTVKLPGGETIPFNLQIPSGEVQLQFYFGTLGIDFTHPLYGLSTATFTTPTVPTPEPGSLGLMVAGLAGLLGLFFKRRTPAF